MNIIGLFLCNKGFSDTESIAAIAPNFLSTESQLLIPLWGLAYIATANDWKKLPMHSLTFCIQKILYAWWWYRLMQDGSNFNEVISMIQNRKKILPGILLLLFGPSDFLFGLLFGYSAWKGFSETDSSKKD